ncbi:hypothetical protein HMI54_004858 [Coelomomyces lativittatus]|nr:hypothetical protein HMI56_006468 [Coelomomyces lativittatus]KAJ1516807.1 hypothetical protein HMI55_001354 [Coelomomyces lativittatus]KAJ1518772.1 hypothetical protein HMI54_004858 [Coelomomyces lativittatus]
MNITSTFVKKELRFIGSKFFGKHLPSSLKGLPEHYQTTFVELSKKSTKFNKHPLLIHPSTGFRFLSKLHPSDFINKVVFEVNAGLGCFSHCVSQILSPSFSTTTTTTTHPLFPTHLKKALSSLNAWYMIEKYPFLKSHLEVHASKLKSATFPLHFRFEDHMNSLFYQHLELEFSQWKSSSLNSTVVPSVTLMATYGPSYGNLNLGYDFKWLALKSGIFQSNNFSFLALIPNKISTTLSAPPGSKFRQRMSVLCQVVCQMEILDSGSPEDFVPYDEMDFVRFVRHPTPLFQGSIFEFDTVLSKLFFKSRQPLRESLNLIDPTGYLLRTLPVELLSKPVHTLSNEELCFIFQVISEWPLKKDFILATS